MFVFSNCKYNITKKYKVNTFFKKNSIFLIFFCIFIDFFRKVVYNSDMEGLK
nr:MAG TPA: hypothetical protein [Caudoviricetes sp.]